MTKKVLIHGAWKYVHSIPYQKQVFEQILGVLSIFQKLFFLAIRYQIMLHINRRRKLQETQ